MLGVGLSSSVMCRNLNIISFNAGGLTAEKHSEIKHFIDNNPEIHIICIQETKFKENFIRSIPGYTPENKIYSKKGGAGGMLVYFKNTINYELINIDNPKDSKGNTLLELQLFRVHLERSSFYLVNLYSRGINMNSLNTISSFLNKNNSKDCVITGDFNAHNEIWGSRFTNRQGRDIWQWIEDNNLILLNDGSNTRLDKGRATFSSIDLTIASPNLSVISEWGMFPDNWGSDHFPQVINIGLNNSNRQNEPTRVKLRYDKANWVKFNQLCKEITLEEVYSVDINAFNDNLNNGFLHAAELAIPVSSGKPHKHKMVPWWNDDCKNAVKGRKTALNQVKQNTCPVNLDNLKEAEKIVKSTILNTKRANWQEFCETVKFKNCNSKTFWQKIHRIKGKLPGPIPLIKVGDILAKTPFEKAQILVKHYSNVSSDSNMLPETLKYQKEFEAQNNQILHEPGEQNIPLNLPFSLSELKKCINSRSDSTAGLDRISYQMFKHMPDSALEIWLNLFNQVWRDGVYPLVWKEACVIPLPKPKKDKNDPKSYRPISLTSHSGKLLEGMVQARLEHFIETKKIISPFQSGFRKGRSTLDQLARLQHDVLAAKNRNRSVLAIFLDLQSAFDLTWHFGVLHKLREHGITGSCFQYLRAFLEDRKIQVRVDGTLSEKETLSRGTPQGAILSPLLFSIIINGLPDTLQGSGMVISQFADDSGTWKSGSVLKNLVKDAQAGLDSLWGWAKNWGFKISESKTVGILFGNLKEHSLNVNLGGTQIKFEKVVRFLGMLLDRRLTFAQHIKDLVNRCQKDIHIMRMLCGTDFGSDKKSLLLLYMSLIRSKIDYGAQIYSSACPTHLKSLDRIQNTALRIALRALSTTPAYMLEIEAGITPLGIRRQEQCVKYWARAQTRKDDNPVNAIFGTGYYCKSRFRDKPLPFGANVQELVAGFGLEGVQVADFRPDLAPPWTLLDPVIDISLSEKVKKSDLAHLARSEVQCHIEENYSNHLKIYTDGSKCPDSGKVAAAVVIPSLQCEYVERLTDKASIYTAELIAIKKAMCWIVDNNSSKNVILSDSLSSLVSLQSRNSKSRPDLINDIVKLYNEGWNRNLQVTIAWCPAHIGITGNELADRAAKSGLEHTNVENSVKLAPTEIYSIVRTQTINRWSQTLLNKPFRQTYRRSSVGLGRPVPYSHSIKMDKCITRLRLGTNLLPGNAGQHILKSDPVCPMCRVRYTTEHFLLDCGEHGTHQTVLRAAITKVGTAFSLENVLNPSKAARTSVYKALETYILDCQMSDKI